MVFKKFIIAFVFLSTGAFVVLKVIPEKTLSPIKNIFSSSASESQEKTLRSVSQTFTSGSQNPSTSQTDLKSEKEVPVPKFDKDNPQAKGVILAFHRWPNEKEKALIVKKLTEAGLKKKSEYKRDKTWVFRWPEWHKAIDAKKLCKELSTLSSVDYCEPNYLLGPAKSKKKKKTATESEAKVEPVSQSADQPVYPEVPPGQENIKTCNIVSHGFFGLGYDLPDYWAQEMIGADLLKEKLQSVKPIGKHLVAVFDSTREEHDRHDIAVRNLISGDGKQAVLPELGNHINIRDVWVPEFYLQNKDVLLNKVQSVCGEENNSGDSGIVFNYDADLTLFAFLLLSNSTDARRKKRRRVKRSTEEDKSEQTSPILADDDPYKQCKANVLPSFINNSMYWGDAFGENAGRTIYNVFKSLSPPSIVVTAAGNLDPTPVPPYKAKASKNFDVIIVGNLTCEGRRSGGSQQGEEVHIMAPGSEQRSADKNGNLMVFGGTSGAAPLVTGSLAGFEWLSGYHPTPEEAKILLEKTAISTLYLPSLENPRMNGVGMVNAYKLGMVGEEFKRLCGTDISCFKKMIRNPAAYKFPEDLDLEEAVEQAFPECSQTCGKNIATCADKGAVFKRLRKAVFSNPSNKTLWRYKACIYASADFIRIAKGALNTYKALFGPSKKEEEVTFCQSDSDCMMAPCPSLLVHPESLSFSFEATTNSGSSSRVWNRTEFEKKSILGKGTSVWAMTKAEAEIQYITGTCKGQLCNNKCRCDTKEYSHLGDTLVSQCINSKCVIKRSFLDTFCKSDTDCVIAPCRPFSVSETQNSASGLWAMSKTEADFHYAAGQCKGVLCNGKQQCDSQEKIITGMDCSPDDSKSECLEEFPIKKLPDGINVTVASRCVYSRCRIQPVETDQPITKTACKSDSDCVMIPCRPPSSEGPSSIIGLWAMTKTEAENLYATRQCQASCNGKSRCNNQETVTLPTAQEACPQNTPISEECIRNIQNLPKELAVTSRCVRSRCRIQPVESSPSEGGASGQR